mgnify:CR=1 FL=1
MYSMGYNGRMEYQIKRTARYAAWFDKLKDRGARARIAMRVDRLAHGNPGQHRVLTGGVVELKIDVGPGYRVYYTHVGKVVVLLLLGGDKSTQTDDIKAALEMAQQLE